MYKYVMDENAEILEKSVVCRYMYRYVMNGEFKDKIKESLDDI